MGCVLSMELCALSGAMCSVRGRVLCMELCALYGAVCSVWGCVLCLGLCTLHGAVCSVWGHVLCLGLCTLHGAVCSVLQSELPGCSLVVLTWHLDQGTQLSPVLPDLTLDQVVGLEATGPRW